MRNFWNANEKSATNYDWYRYAYGADDHKDNKILFHFDTERFSKHDTCISTKYTCKNYTLNSCFVYLIAEHKLPFHYFYWRKVP